MNRVTFTIGQGLDKDGMIIPTIDLKRKRAYKAIAEAYGGYTAILGMGGWISPKGELVEEDSLTIVVYSMLDGRSMAQWLRELFNQEQVMLTIEPCQVEFIQ